MVSNNINSKVKNIDRYKTTPNKALPRETSWGF